MVKHNLTDLRKQALQRARYRCEWAECNSSEWLELTNIEEMSLGAVVGDPKWTIDNVIMLCKKHHDVLKQKTTATKRAYEKLVKDYLRIKYR